MLFGVALSSADIHKSFTKCRTLFTLISYSASTMLNTSSFSSDHPFSGCSQA